MLAGIPAEGKAPEPASRPAPAEARSEHTALTNGAGSSRVPDGPPPASAQAAGVRPVQIAASLQRWNSHGALIACHGSGRGRARTRAQVPARGFLRVGKRTDR